MTGAPWSALRLAQDAGATLSWPQLDAGNFPAALIAAASSGKGAVLLIAPDEQQAWRLEHALRFYA